MTPAPPRKEPRREITTLLQDARVGKPGASERLAAAVHADLKLMARRRLEKDFGRNLAGITIQPTILANDTLLKLLRQRKGFEDGAHFFAIASRKMWEVLLDYHRRRKARHPRNGALLVALDSDGGGTASEPCPVDVEALHDHLESLGRLDPRKREVLEYRMLWNFTIEETGAALGVGHATVERDLAFAQAWILKEFARHGDRPAGP